jgi:cytochrome c
MMRFVLCLLLVLCGSVASAQDKRAALEARRQQAGNLVGHGGPVKAIAVDALRSTALTGSFDYAMMVWDVSGDVPKLHHRLADHDGAVNAVAFINAVVLEARMPPMAVSAGDDGFVRIWDLQAGKLIHKHPGHDGKILGLDVVGGWIASAGWDRTVRLWHLGRPGPVLTGHKGPVNAVALSPDGKSVYTASYDGTISVFRGVKDLSADVDFDRVLLRHGWGVNVLKLIPSRLRGQPDRLVFGALDGTVGVIDVISGEVTELPKHSRPVLALATTPERIATSGGDGQIRVYDARDGQPIETYKNPFGPVWALGFTGWTEDKAEGSHLYYGGLDDFATLWRVTPKSAPEALESPFPRRFQATKGGNDLLAEGELQFARKCSICHTLTGETQNRAGPSLANVFGRRIATLPGYPFSEPLKHLDIVWGPETIGKLFELGPEVFTPGSKMPLQKITDAAQRDALIAYLRVATVDAGPAKASESAETTTKRP